MRDGPSPKPAALRRSDLPSCAKGFSSARLADPAIVEQPDTTVVIDPCATAVVDALGNLVISVGAT